MEKSEIVKKLIDYMEREKVSVRRAMKDLKIDYASQSLCAWPEYREARGLPPLDKSAKKQPNHQTIIVPRQLEKKTEAGFAFNGDPRAVADFIHQLSKNFGDNK